MIPPVADPPERDRSNDSPGERLRAELREAPIRLRILLPVYLAIGAFGGFYGGYALTRAYSNWLTWSVSFLVLEPIGVVSALALLLLVFPDAPASGMFLRALRRAKIAAVLVGVVFVGAIAWALIWIAVELVRTYWL